MCDTFFKSAEQSTTSKMSERKVLNVSICRYYIREIIAFVTSKHWFSVNTGNAFQCQKMLYTKHEEEEPPLLHIKQPNPGTSTIKPLPWTTNSRRPQTVISLRLGFQRNLLSVLHPNLVSSPIKGILEILNLTSRCIPMDILAWTDCVRSSAGKIS